MQSETNVRYFEGIICHNPPLWRFFLIKTEAKKLEHKKHQSGFISIVGNPNVGKSTLMNALVGKELSIITAKAQTTRHRILGIINGDDFQMVL